MAATYKKLYLYLVGQIDDTLEMIGKKYFEEGYAKDKLLVETVNKLKEALLKAEDMYIGSEEEGLKGE